MNPSGKWQDLLRKRGGNSWSLYGPLIVPQAFFFRDEQNRIDNNRGEYWDIPICRDGEPDPAAVSERASIYNGRLIAPGIQRAPDLTPAIEILKDDLKRRPADYGLYFPLWQVSRELDAFVTAHGTEPDALIQISGFIGPE